MTAPYLCEHKPRCQCARAAEATHAQLCDALNARNRLRKETDAERAEYQSRIHALRASEATLTAQLRARDEALRVAREALRREADDACLACGSIWPDEHDEFCRFAVALAAIREAGRG